jgi:outer membrane lipoprotein-sorting protein
MPEGPPRCCAGRSEAESIGRRRAQRHTRMRDGRRAGHVNVPHDLGTKAARHVSRTLARRVVRSRSRSSALTCHLPRIPAATRRSLSGEMNAAGSKSRIVAAQCDRQSAVSKRVIGAMPLLPDSIASMIARWPMPKQETQPIPVITTRSEIDAVRYHAVVRRSMLSASALLQLFAAAALVASQAQAPKDLFDQLFARTMEKRQSIHSIRGRFTETTTSSLLEKPLVSHGTVIAAPPSRVLMTYTDPEPRTVAIDSKSLVVVWPDRGERETIDISQTQKRIDQYFTQATIGQLRSMFEIAAQPDAVIRGTDRVDMRPKRKQIKEGLERLEIWIDRETLFLAQMQMTFPGGDRKTIRLDDVTVNVPVTAETFLIRP